MSVGKCQTGERRFTRLKCRFVHRVLAGANGKETMAQYFKREPRDSLILNRENSPTRLARGGKFEITRARVVYLAIGVDVTQ